MKNFQLSEINFSRIWVQIRRTVLYGLYLLLFLLLQDVVFSHISPLGVRSMFMPALVVGVAEFEGGRTGGIFGLFAGIACDLLFSSQRVLFTILFPVMGFVAGLLVDFYLNRRFFSYAVMAVLALFAAAFAQMFALLFFLDQGSVHLWFTAVLQTLWSLPFVPLAYYLCKIFPWRSHEHAPSPY